MKYAVETIGLTKTFTDWWGRTKVLAVDDLNLQIRTNEVFGLLGPNGSGKTTTLKMLLGLLHPTKGSALLLGGDGTDPKINTRIGFLPEESYLYRYLNPRETLDFYGQLFGLSRQLRKERIEVLLDMVGLKAVASRPVGTFSKGMARRIGLAQALINDPDLLILDEPTTGLDPIGTRQIKDLIIKLAERGKTVLLCSHLLADVEDVCDRIAILYGGRVQAEGDVTLLLRQADKRQITTGSLSDSALDQIRRVIEAEHTDCEVSSPMERLETFFVRTVYEAQQQEQPTQGAFSTTHIGEFLSGDAQKDVLDQLVSAQVFDEISTEPIQTEKVISEKAPEPDKQLLDQLTEKQPPVDTQEVVSEESQAGPSETFTQESIKKNILDQLVDPQQTGDINTEIPQEDDTNHG